MDLAKAYLRLHECAPGAFLRMVDDVLEGRASPLPDVAVAGFCTPDIPVGRGIVDLETGLACYAAGKGKPRGLVTSSPAEWLAGFVIPDPAVYPDASVWACTLALAAERAPEIMRDVSPDSIVLPAGGRWLRIVTPRRQVTAVAGASVAVVIDHGHDVVVCRGDDEDQWQRRIVPVIRAVLSLEANYDPVSD